MIKHIHSFLHRHGIARVLNSSSASNHDMGRAMVEVFAFPWAAKEMAIFAVRHSPVIRCYWDTIHVRSMEQIGYFRYQLTLTYVRMR